jgi:O-methyltransferase involved in polyketide biosynthesis
MTGTHTALMSGSRPSRTARMAAVASALHLFAHGPRALLTDWLAWPLVGAAAETIAAGSPTVLGDLQEPFMTWFAARSRITEDWLAANGAGQYVILGAGLDSFVARIPPPPTTATTRRATAKPRQAEPVARTQRLVADVVTPARASNLDSSATSETVPPVVDLAAARTKRTEQPKLERGLLDFHEPPGASSAW